MISVSQLAHTVAKSQQQRDFYVPRRRRPNVAGHAIVTPRILENYQQQGRAVDLRHSALKITHLRA